MPNKPSDDSVDTSAFARLLREAEVSDTRFAAQVNIRARQQRQIDLGLARTTIGHWRRGMRPRDPMVAELAAAELSAGLGYPVLPSDLGWRGESYRHDELGLTGAGAPVETLRTLAGLSGRDMHRRDLLQESTAFIATAFADPVLSSLTGVIDRVTGAHEPVAGSGALIRDVTETFRRLDAKFGGGEIRPQVVSFLHDQTRAARDRRPDRDLFSALAELTQFSGWLAQDSRRHGLAQRYYIQALSLAEHADDTMLAGRVLSGMSDQAAQLGHLRQSLALARAAMNRSADDSTWAVKAMLFDKQAWALARNKDEYGCRAALDKLDDAISRVGDDDAESPSWAGHYNLGDVAECRGHCLRLLERPEEAERQLVGARALQGAARARTRSYAEADLALAYLQRRSPELEGALEASDRALDVAGQVTSLRIVTKLTELDDALSVHPTVAVREWRARARPLLSAARPAGGPAAA
ncbi:transcriptional regulator [Frankia sp. AgPm24]|uniref:transcriptional regulator n=1 Tax=Frankia sp. AgPm24 TaxID=631128 RepID=UPI00200F797C|nr:transcriptional regulator [Frankia sp. AgPm24]MCK9924106.1 transcriptional regulator [Frankia sp. AgPm24]